VNDEQVFCVHWCHQCPDSTARLIVHVLLTATRIEAAVNTKPKRILRLA
jgi:hypothetical protein